MRLGCTWRFFILVQVCSWSWLEFFGFHFSEEEKRQRLEILVAQNAKRINAGTSDRIPPSTLFSLPSLSPSLKIPLLAIRRVSLSLSITSGHVAWTIVQQTNKQTNKQTTHFASSPHADYIEKMTRGSEHGEGLSEEVKAQIWKVSLESAQGEARAQLRSELEREEKARLNKARGWFWFWFDSISEQGGKLNSGNKTNYKNGVTSSWWLLLSALDRLPFCL
jgi:hypothetical protein